MTGASDDSRGRVGARPWILVGSLLALGAAAAMVFADDFRWLRLGIVAALWAALLGAFVAARSHKHARVSEQATLDAQAVYELELEREVAARREHELEAASEARSRVDSETREEVESLRSEVMALRDSLQQLMGGELLYERVALTAESTRMRHVGEKGSQPVAGSAQNGAAGGDAAENRGVQRALDPGSSQQNELGHTEVFRAVPAAEQRESQVANVSRQRPARSSESERSAGAQPKPADPARPRQQPPRQQPPRQPGRPPARQPGQPPASQPARSQAAGQQWSGATNQPRTDVTGGSQAHQPGTARPSTGSKSAAEQVPHPAGQPQGSTRPPEQPLRQSQQQPQQSAQQRGNQPQQAANQSSQRPPQQSAQQRGNQPQQAANHPPQSTGQPQRPEAPARTGQPGGSSDSGEAGSRRPVRGDEHPDGRNGRAEAADTDTPAAQSGQEPSAEETSGSHAEGRSVSELLAAYGSTGSSGSHRRRRAQ